MGKSKKTEQVIAEVIAENVEQVASSPVSDWDNVNTKTAINLAERASETQRLYVRGMIDSCLFDDTLRGLAFQNGDNRDELAVKIADSLAVYREAQLLTDSLLALSDAIGMDEKTQQALRDSILAPKVEGLNAEIVSRIYGSFPAHVVKTCEGNGGKNEGTKRLKRSAMLASIRRENGEVIGDMILDSRCMATVYKLAIKKSDWQNLTSPSGVKCNSQRELIGQVVNIEMGCNPPIDLTSGSVRNAETTMRELFSQSNIATIK